MISNIIIFPCYLQTFTTDSSSRKLYTMWRPAHGQVYRFNIVNRARNTLSPFDNNFYWNIMLFGCPTETTASTPVDNTVPMTQMPRAVTSSSTSSCGRGNYCCISISTNCSWRQSVRSHHCWRVSMCGCCATRAAHCDMLTTLCSPI